MRSFDALKLFAAQLERNIRGNTFKTKVVIAPTAVEEKGVVIKLALLKSTPDNARKARFATRTLRIRVSVQGAIESLTGLEQVCDAIERLDSYLAAPQLHLKELGETTSGMTGEISIAGTRVIQRLSEEDSFVDSPDSTALVSADDDRIVLLTIPAEVS